MAKVLLFNPPGPEGRSYIREGRCTQEAGAWATCWPPVTLATAAAVLETDGHEVRVIDFPATGRSLADLEKELRLFRPDIAVWSTGTPTLPFDLAVARLVKEASHGTRTAVMGTHVTVRPEEALREAALDAVVRGEPEMVIRNFCRAGKAGMEGVRGISWRANGKGILHNEAEPLLAPEEIPAPAWHHLDLEAYRLPLKGRRFLIVAPIRGCPYSCSFCTAPLYYGKKLRMRPVGSVLAEMEGNIARHGVREFFLWADTFTADRAYVEAFCREILDRRLAVSWTCNSRVDSVDGGLLRLMKKAGLWMISFGLESGNDGILARMGKRITKEQSRRAVAEAHAAGLRTAGHFILGLPGETGQTMAETLAFALDLPLDVGQFYAAAPFPGTALYDEALARGWLAEPDGFSQNRSALRIPGLPPEKVDAFRREAYRRFYRRPSTVLHLLSMVEPGVIGHFGGTLRKFSRWSGLSER
ncbi:MAG: Oxygen-independent coproporphyrinogen-III oxidase 1 [Syntrophaceae bacterium PtaU1.Bin231]|nr:MAG: Oxygen-independent coproporphyrinogen-III oxidase 1 [Syntrophaceae bacterium PtaU1.Bin231]